MSHQKDGEKTARMLANRMSATPAMNIRFLPTMSAALDSGTMNTTDDMRKAVLTYPSIWDPTANSSPIPTSERFIMVLSRGVTNPERQHASRTSFISLPV